MKTEEDLHTKLIEYFSELEKGETDAAMDPDGKFAFVVVAFCKPSNPSAFIQRAGDEKPQRGDKQAAVGVAMAQACPAVGKAAADGMVEAHKVMREGVHALCASVMAKYLSEVALPLIVGQAQMVMRKREVSLDA